MYQVTHGTFKTPRGKSVTMAYREDTNDYNTLNACMTEDEYGLKDLRLEGFALDVGGHIGGVTIGLLIDNPDLHVVTIEAVPPNAELIWENLERNDLTSRCTLINAAAAPGKTFKVRWAFKGNEGADHHTFIGNAYMPETDLSSHSEISVDCRSLGSLVKEFGPFSFAKVDCEGCEFGFLKGPALKAVKLIRGEVHADPQPLYEALKATHNTTIPHTIPGAFEAVLRA
jgi:FkbM family methyltransferase